MAMNVFEGARRITKLLAALWVVGWVIAAFYVSPSVDVTYKIANPGAVPVRITEEECPPGSATKYISDKVTRSGTKTLVFLCFPSFRVADGSRSSAEIAMSTFKVTAPDGSTIHVNAPVGATEQQAIEFAATTWKPQSSPLEELPDALISKEEELEFRLRLAEERFILPQSDEKWIDRQWWFFFMKEIGWGALGAVGGLLFLLAFTWTAGWIARGFMGIPRGQDHRVKNGEMK